MGQPEDSITPVSLIGTGMMGRGMAQNLLAAGFELVVHNRTLGKAEPLLRDGARWVDSVAAAATAAPFVITMVGWPEEVRQVYYDPLGILASAHRGTTLIDMGTSPPSLAREIGRSASERGLAFLDAPVSGGEAGARAGTLSIMVGGQRHDLERARPLLSAMGRTIVHQGPNGSGQHAKMCNQITVASNVVGVCEALLYARAAGLDPAVVLESIGAGAAASWSLANLYPRMVRQDYAAGFHVAHFLKDMRIALDESEHMGLELPGLLLAKRLYERLVELGGDQLGTQALCLALEDLQQRPPDRASPANDGAEP
jgi:3-hydroxyisobutyrate dehydrogenase